MNFTIGEMRADEYDVCLDMAVSAFLTNNPMFVHTKMPQDVFRRFAQGDCSREATVDSGLSLVARNADGSPIAFLFNKVADFSKTDPGQFSQLHPCFSHMLEGMEKLYAEAVLKPLSGLRLYSLTSGKTLHCALGGTLPAANGQGVAKALRLAAVELARKRGFNSLLVEPAHGATRHIWTKHCGARVQAELDFDTFRTASGEFPFAGVEGSISVCEVVVRKSCWDSAIFWPYYLKKLGAQVKRAAAKASGGVSPKTGGG
mmetsp:Transcript_23370/g.72793  ORF Transcript_23370/g.72793 Transcript_23370/m.72793 type:complete len:259 (+) Transcript_23370:164-940(+)